MLDCFAAPSQRQRDLDDDVDAAPLECNYDVDPTDLYQAIEDKAFMAAIDMLESHEQLHFDAARTWVTRYETDGRIRWSQLPLHGAVLFKAPIRLIELLVKAYPKAVRCTNDQKMLPLHLAWRHGASDNVLHLLLSAFPEAVHAEDHKGRTPLSFAKDGDIWKKGEIVEIYIEQSRIADEKKIVSEELDDMTARLKDEEDKASELEVELDATKTDLANKKKDVEDLTKQLHEAKADMIELKRKSELLKAAAASSKSRSSSQRSPSSKPSVSSPSGTTPTPKPASTEKNSGTRTSSAPAPKTNERKKGWKGFVKGFQKKSKTATPVKSSAGTIKSSAGTVKSGTVKSTTAKSGAAESSKSSKLSTASTKLVDNKSKNKDAGESKTNKIETVVEDNPASETATEGSSVDAKQQEVEVAVAK